MDCSFVLWFLPAGYPVFLACVNGRFLFFRATHRNEACACSIMAMRLLILLQESKSIRSVNGFYNRSGLLEYERIRRADFVCSLFLNFSVGVVFPADEDLPW